MIFVNRNTFSFTDKVSWKILQEEEEEHNQLQTRFAFLKT